MKNLLLILTLFLCLDSYSQDTTIFIQAELIEETKETILFRSDFITIDTVNFDINQDTLFTEYKDWIVTKVTQVNPKIKRVRSIQFRVNDQGIKQKRFRIVRFVTKNRLKRTIR